MIIYSKYQGSILCLVVQERKIFKVLIPKIYFHSSDLVMQQTGTMKNHSAKFGPNPASSLGDVL